MATAFSVHAGTTPLFLLIAEAQALLRKPPHELPEPVHRRCIEPNCTTVITDIDTTTATVRIRCWEHGSHHRPGQRLYCPCGSTVHGWCANASKPLAPNKPGPLNPEWAELVL